MEEGFRKGLSCLFYNAREFVWVCVRARFSWSKGTEHYGIVTKQPLRTTANPYKFFYDS